MFERMDFGMAGMDALLWWPVLGLLWPDYWEVRQVRGGDGGDRRVMQAEKHFWDRLARKQIQCMSCARCGIWKVLSQVCEFKLNHIYLLHLVLLLLCNFSRIIAIHRPIGLVDAQQKTRGKADNKHVLKAVAAYPVQGASSKLQRIINDPKASIATYHTMLFFFFWRNPYFEVGFSLPHFFRWSAFVAMAAVNHKAPMPWSLTWRNLCFGLCRISMN